MHNSLAKLALAIALAGALAPAQAWADAGDDQYAVAAAHYARDRWQLAIDEFQAFRKDFPRHAKFNQALFFEAEAHVQLGQFRDAGELFAQYANAEPKGRYHRQALFRWGETCYLLDDHEAAKPVLEKFRQTYAQDKLNAYVLAYLGQIAVAAKDPGTARKHFEACLKEFPESQVQDECRFGLARIAEDAGEADAAERIYLALSAKVASSWADDAQFRLGAMQYAAGDYATSLKTFEAFEATFKQSDLLPRARLSRGWALYQLEQTEKAAGLFAMLKDHEQVSHEARYWLGLTQKAQRNWGEAAETLLAAAKAAPKHELAPAMVFHAGDSLSRAGEREPAIKQFDRLLSTWPKDAWADDALLAKLQLKLTAADHPQVDALVTEFRQRFAESPISGEVRRVQAQSLLTRKEYDRAAELMQDGDDDSDRYLLAVARQGLNQHEDAIAALTPVLKQAKGKLLADARMLQAAALVALARHEEAIEPLDAHLAADPQGADSARCRAQLATCYARTGDLAKAREAFKAFGEQQPPSELRHSATQQMAEAAFAAGDYAWSAELFGSLTSKEAPAGVAARGLSGLGWTHYKAGELEPAADAFEKLIERYPNDPLAVEGTLTRGQIFERLKNGEQALVMYRRVIEKYAQTKEYAIALLGAARMTDKLGQDEEAAGLYQRLIKEFPQHESLDAALYEWGWVLRELGRMDESDQRFQTLYKDHKQSRYWADATFRLAERAQATRRHEEAQSLLADLTAAQADQKTPPHVRFLQGQTAAGLERWSDVIDIMRPLAEGEDSPYKSLCEYWIAEALYRQGEFAASGERLAALSTKLADSREPWIAMVALRHAQVLAQQKKWKETLDVASGIRERWPQFDQQHEADYVIGRALAARGELTDARAAYQRVTRSETGGKTETAAMAQWMIGETYFHQKNYDAALREYLRVEILYAYPTWQAAALLQAGKCAEQLGQWKQAAEVYQRIVKDFSETSFVEEAQMRLTLARERLAGR